MGKMARAYVCPEGRDFVIPEDMKKSVRDVASHRIRVNQQARLSKKTSADILEEIMELVKAPKLTDKQL